MNRYNEGYYESDTEALARRQTAWLIVAFKYIGIFLFRCLVYSSSLVAAFYIMQHKTFYLQASRLGKLAYLIIGAYLITCVLYLLKGLMIALKANRKPVWYLLWAVCFTFVCLLPMVAIYFLLEMSLGPAPMGRGTVEHYQLWSAAAALAAGILIYSQYDLGKDKTLKLTAWAYQIGLNLGRGTSSH
ncbi:hypothetical protein HNQ91_002965 [Filimonas zeae]|uniref:Uncharacterized protein n=1 Tax=Filimonas zeae TaxID=1737353 RepID=A0A917MWS8_9BACT|nr:hypothetical protein [Filimonas zeae]MDR6339900.1 hypothetical protein [Filimonas zeae]GGH70217.1 hypothetical protein GCM10011379_28250 [Filimonas zeae]